MADSSTWGKDRIEAACEGEAQLEVPIAGIWKSQLTPAHPSGL